MINNKKSRFKVFSFLLISLVVLALGSCRKDDFDEPPINGDDPNLQVNITIDSLKKYWTSGSLYTIDKDWIIAGTIVADDKSGNYYKTIVIEDSTAGISIRLDVGGFYGTYPVGRRLFVKCKGLILGDYGGLIQLGGYIDNSSGTPTAATIPSSLVTKHFFPGQWNLNPKPSVVTIAELKSVAGRKKWQNRLVQINDAEFIPGDTGQVWADVINGISKNRTFQECGGTDQAIVRTSSFADFAGTKTPGKNGSLVGIFTIYNSDNQLVIRDLNDISLMTNNYCGDGPGPGVISEGFDNIVASSPISLTGWTNVAVQGNKTWLGKTFSSEKFAEVTAYQSSLPAMESWLVTPGFSIAAGDTLSFKTEHAFWRADQLTVWISNDFTGNPSTATWQQLNPALPVSSTANYAWIKSGDLDLTSFGFTGTCHIGFKYLGDGTTNTTTIRIDNVRVR